ncbi:MAG: outer membrane beta-barrel protein [Chitinophagaceae bacterium]|nr:outer membrane beta-barrel protein [Chitinophagaceae bacterium]
MKKLLILAMALLVCGALQAQGSKEKVNPKSFLAFHAGPSIPIGDFYNSDYDNADAGFARIGFNPNLTYGYQFAKNFGLTASIFFNKNKLDNIAIQEAMEAVFEVEPGSFKGLKLDHWKWYGVTVGPALIYNFTPYVAGDIRIMAGIVNANTPAITFQGETLAGEDWSVAMPLQAGADLRIGIGKNKNTFIFVNIDYLYMKPKFNVDSDLDELVSETFKQKISVINLTGGLGIRF